MSREQVSRHVAAAQTATHAPEGAASEHQTSFSSHGALPPVAHAAAAAASSPSASDRAFGAAHDKHGHHHIPGGDRNVPIGDINDQHQGWDTKHKHHDQASRLGLGKHHDTPKLAADTKIYTNDGNSIGHLSAGHEVPVNAGAICHLIIDGKKVVCVLGHGQPPGWIPVAHFERSALIEKLSSQLSHEINQARHTGHDAKHGQAPKTITNHPISAATNHLFTKPNQQSDTANHAADYFVRSGNRVNLLINIPTWGEDGERFGVAGDVVVAVDPGTTEVPEESKFHPTGQQAQSPLFHRGSDKRAGHITFVYGYVVNNAGEKRFGWINAHLLS